MPEGKKKNERKREEGENRDPKLNRKRPGNDKNIQFF
jgi:hypothetical protein